MKRTEHDEIKLRLGDMLFTWDDEKERINIRKHGDVCGLCRAHNDRRQ